MNYYNWFEPQVTCYHNAVYYQGNIYVNETEIKTVCLHNRLIRTWTPQSISQLDNIIDVNNIKTSDVGVCLVEGFNCNIAHNLWDAMYPSWYGLFSYFPNIAISENFQWVMTCPLENLWRTDMAKTFSGLEIKQLSDFSDQPIRIPWLICGVHGIGANNMSRDGCIQITIPKFESTHKTDPVDTFINRIYERYNIIRNTIVPNDYFIVWIDSKRKQNNVEECIKEIKKQTNKVVLYLKWENYSFEEQLKLLNQIGILIVGIGTARFKTPFLPHGAIEIQTGHFAHWNLQSYIQYFDSQAGSLTNYVKVKNIERYTEEECANANCSNQILPFVTDSVKEMEETIRKQTVIFVQRVDNIPQEIRKKLDETHKKYPGKFEQWRSQTLSTDIIDYCYDNVF